MSKKIKNAPEDFLRLADEYFRALRLLDEVNKDKVPDIYQIKTQDDYKKIKEHPGYPLLFDMISVKLFLSRHSLELGLKAFLLFSGVSIKQLKDRKLYHHNIVKCLRGAQKRGLNIFNESNQESAKANVFIEELNKCCFDKAYEYPNESIKAFFKEYLDIIENVLESVRQKIKTTA